MSVKYADRAFISVNGTRLVDVQSASLRQNKNARVVPTMTPDSFNRGFTQGNRDIDITLSLAQRNLQARPKLENIDYEVNDVQLTFISGAERFICTGLFNKDTTDDASGVGNEVRATMNFGAIKITDAVGNPVDFDIGLVEEG